MENYFFQIRGYEKKNGFDSYSKNTDDIIEFYYSKHAEVPSHLKREQTLSLDEIKLISSDDTGSYKKALLSDLKSNSAFELYILGFVFAMSADYSQAEEHFLSCIALLDDTLSSKVNRNFIFLQLAQLYERQEMFADAFLTLKKVYDAIYADDQLIEHINNFYASCCTSIGLLLYRKFNKPRVAGALFSKAVQLRIRYKENYPPQVFENYLSTVFRYYAECYLTRAGDKYIIYKSAYDIRTDLIAKTTDEFTKTEYLHLCTDFLHFLISNKYAIKYVNKVARQLFKAIISLKADSFKNSISALRQVSSMLSRYYYFEDDFMKFFKWYALLKEIKGRYKLSFEEGFLESEGIYNLMKA